jgi:chitosanase
MFYGIYGDTDGDSPQVIGEASWLMARTCFPNDDLNGNSGHGGVDVTCEFMTLLPNPPSNLVHPPIFSTNL